MRTVSVRRTTLIMAGCVAFLVGLGISRVGLSVPVLLLVPLGLIVIVAYHKQSGLALFSIVAFGLVGGVVRGQVFLPKVIEYTNLHQQKAVLEITADSDAVYDERQQLSFDGTSIVVIEPYKTHLIGKIKVAGFGENAIYKGDRLLIKGKIFQTRGSRQASIGFAEIQLIERGNSRINSVRRQFAAGLSNVLPDPEAPFGLGLLIGQRNTLDKETTGWLAAAGLTHIIAVSGYNLTIIVRFVHRLLAKRSRYQTVMFSVIIIGVFLLMTGFSASIVRAAIVCGMSLMAWYYGHRFRPLLLLLIAACTTAGWYPIYIWSDIGWYLSFLAFFGVLILAPLLTSRLFRKLPKPITSAIIETFCAQLLTLPLVLYIFNEASIVALLSNALIVPLVPLAMLFTLVAGITGMINVPVLNFLSLPGRLLLTYIIDLAHLLSQVPHAVVSLGISAAIMVVSYIGIVLICLVLWKKNIQKHAIITDVI